jgi:hypothetical protein
MFTAYPLAVIFLLPSVLVWHPRPGSAEVGNNLGVHGAWRVSLQPRLLPRRTVSGIVRSVYACVGVVKQVVVQ